METHKVGDAIKHPKHYNQGKVEVIEFIEDQQMSYHLGNATKYISRAGKKDPAKYVEDLKKAIWYIERQIELTKESPRRPNDMNPKENQTPPPVPQDTKKPEKITPPANQLDMLNSFLKGDANPSMTMAKKAFEDGYKRGFQTGYLKGEKGEKPEYDPKLHNDGSLYGYASEVLLKTFNDDEDSWFALYRSPKKLIPDPSKFTFVRITPLGEA